MEQSQFSVYGRGALSNRLVLFCLGPALHLDPFFCFEVRIRDRKLRPQILSPSDNQPSPVTTSTVVRVKLMNNEIS